MRRAGYGGCSRGRQADAAVCCPLLSLTRQCHDRHQTPDCSCGSLMTVFTAALYGNSGGKLSPALTSGNLIRVCQIVLWCGGASCWLQLCCCGRLDVHEVLLQWSSKQLEASSAALCTEKSYAVNRYQFNRYVTFGFLSLCDSGWAKFKSNASGW